MSTYERLPIDQDREDDDDGMGVVGRLAGLGLGFVCGVVFVCWLAGGR